MLDSSDAAIVWVDRTVLKEYVNVQYFGLIVGTLRVLIVRVQGNNGAIVAYQWTSCLVIVTLIECRLLFIFISRFTLIFMIVIGLCTSLMGI